MSNLAKIFNARSKMMRNASSSDSKATPGQHFYYPLNSSSFTNKWVQPITRRSQTSSLNVVNNENIIHSYYYTKLNSNWRYVLM